MCVTKYSSLWPSQTEAFFLNHHTKLWGMTRVKTSDDYTHSIKVKLGLGEQCYTLRLGRKLLSNFGSDSS